MYSVVLLAALTSGPAAPAWQDDATTAPAPVYGEHGHRSYRHRRGGCCGCCGGCYGGCWGGCSGCWGGCYGCYGGCYGGCGGGWACYGGCHGCSGGYGSYYSSGGYYSSSPYGGGGSYYGAPAYAMPSADGYGYEVERSGSEGREEIGTGERDRGTRDRGRDADSDRSRGRSSDRGSDADRDRGSDRNRKSPSRDETRRPAPARIIVRLPGDAVLTIDGEQTRSTSATRTLETPPLARGKVYTYTLRAEGRRDGRTVAVTRDVTVRPGTITRVSLDLSDAAVARR